MFRTFFFQPTRLALPHAQFTFRFKLKTPVQCSRSSVSKNTNTHTLNSTRLVSRLAHSQYTYIEIVVVFKCVQRYIAAVDAPRIYWRKLTKHIYWQLSNRQQGERSICRHHHLRETRRPTSAHCNCTVFILSLSLSLTNCITPCVCASISALTCVCVCAYVRILVVVFIFCECIQPIESELQVKIEFDKRQTDRRTKN